MRPERPQGVRGAAIITLDHALTKRSLFEIFDRTNQSLIILHFASFLLRGRAVARPSCVYAVDFGGCGGMVDNDGIDEVDGIVGIRTSLCIYFLKIWSFDVDFGPHW